MLVTYSRRVAGFDANRRPLLHRNGSLSRSNKQIKPSSEVLQELKALDPISPEFWRKGEENSVRYYGYLDLDAKSESMGTDELKQHIRECIYGSRTLQDLYDTCEPLRDVFDAAGRIVNETENCFAFFTGFKGARVLFSPDQFWARGSVHGSYGNQGLELARSALSEELNRYVSERCTVDTQVYGKSMGIKSDLLPHYVTGLHAVRLDDLTARLQSEHLSPDLEQDIRNYWTAVFENAEVMLETAPVFPNDTKKRKAETGDRSGEARVFELLEECGVEGGEEAVIKPHGGKAYVAHIPDERKCRVGNRVHSKAGKSYYIVDIEKLRVYPKCFACSTSGDSAPLLPSWLAFQQDVLEYDTPAFVREYVRLVNGRIKMVNDSDKHCYIYNSESALWESQSHQFAENLVGELLQPIVKKFMIEGGEKRKHSFMKFVGSTVGQRNIFLQARTRFKDPKFKVNFIPHLLPIQRARVVDLRTGEVRERRAEDYFSFQCEVDFDGDLQRETPHADQFFSDVFGRFYDYMRRQLGYCLTGEMSARAYFIWWGRGANGKGGCSELLKRVLGDFFTTLQPKAVMSWKDSFAAPSNASPHLVSLATARVAMVSETGPNDQLNENFVKSWTGSDEICVRALYQGEEKIKPQAKLILQTNNKPRVSADQSIVDRTHFTAFEARFAKEPTGNEKLADPSVIKALCNQFLPEVFLWMLRGSMEFYVQGLKLDSAALQSTMEFIEEHDFITAFVRSECVEGTSLRTARTELYNCFDNWREAQHLQKITATEFYSKLLNKGYVIGVGGNRKVHGLRPRLPAELEARQQEQETQLQNSVENFIQTRCVRVEDGRTPRAELHACFQQFLKKQVETKPFYTQLRGLGYIISKNGQRPVHGLRVRHQIAETKAVAEVEVAPQAAGERMDEDDADVAAALEAEADGVERTETLPGHSYGKEDEGFW